MSQSACCSNKIPARIYLQDGKKQHALTIPHQRDRVLKFVQIDKTALNLQRIILRCLVNKLNIRNMLNQLSLIQLVKVPPRGQNIVDVFITNAPHNWKKVKGGSEKPSKI